MILIGNVSDSSTEETLPGASVFISDSAGKPIGEGTQTNADGAYILTVTPGQYVTARYIGYEPQTYQVQANDNDKQFQLSSKGVELNIVNIIDTRLKRVRNWRGIAAASALLAISFGLVFGLGRKES